MVCARTGVLYRHDVAHVHSFDVRNAICHRQIALLISKELIAIDTLIHNVIIMNNIKLKEWNGDVLIDETFMQ